MFLVGSKNFVCIHAHVQTAFFPELLGGLVILWMKQSINNSYDKKITKVDTDWMITQVSNKDCVNNIPTIYKKPG
jgi:hypothetical protein